jgi:hypothetical protein
LGGRRQSASRCSDVTCEPFLGSGEGACCDGSSCSVKHFLFCGHGKTFSHGKFCHEVTCDAMLPATVACCHGDGSCTDVSDADCTAAGGTPGAEGSTCALASCAPPDPTGACCLPGVECFDDATEAECMASGGAWTQDGACGDAPCECKIGQCPDEQECVLGTCVSAEHTDKDFVSVKSPSGVYLAGQAEQYSARCFHEADESYSWQVSSDGEACEDEYVSVQPDGTHGALHATVISPFIDYKIEVSEAGAYRFWVRAAKVSGTADSFYASIVELREAGVSPLWYRIAPGGSGYSWYGQGGLELTNAGGSNSDMGFMFAAPGTYTLRISNREDGTPVDAWMLIKNDAFNPSSSGCIESTCRCREVQGDCEDGVTADTSAHTNGKCIGLLF